MPRPARPTLAVIMPVYVEPEVERQLERLCGLALDELIVVTADDAPTQVRLAAFQDAHAGPAPLQVLDSARGRARQMNAGARAARADVLLFLHADTVLPPDATRRIREAVAGGAIWGRFDVRLSGRHPAFRLIERLMNLRSTLTGIATGDQALFVRRDAFTLLGGFAPLELMEDVELSTRLKWFGRPARIRTPVVSSSRRWERGGVWRTVVRMWVLRALYALGVSPRRLARWYK